jgi:di/tricarboxylate transporter
MGIGISVFLIAVGAVLAFAVHVFAQGVNTTAIGYILMAVGGIGLLAALVISGAGSWGGVRRTSVVDDGARARRVDTYVN